MNLSTYSRRPKTFIALLLIASLMLAAASAALAMGAAWQTVRSVAPGRAAARG